MCGVDAVTHGVVYHFVARQNIFEVKVPADHERPRCLRSAALDRCRRRSGRSTT
jgi:hypothetical protein